MNAPQLELKDYISNGLTLVAITLSILVWRTSDTRISEIRQKVVKYSVESGGGSAASGFGERPDEPVTESDEIYVEMTNTGSLPVGGVTLSVSSQTIGNGHLASEVQLKPAVDHEIVQQGNDFVVRLKNPVGPNEHISATVRISDTFPANVKDGFKLDQAYVDSEVGAAIYVPSLGSGKIEQAGGVSH
jgi:hypothetical protein